MICEGGRRHYGLKTRKKSGGHVRANVRRGRRMTCTVRMNREQVLFLDMSGDIVGWHHRVLLRVRLMQNGFAVFEHVRYIVISFRLPFESLMGREIENKGDEERWWKKGSGRSSRFSFPSCDHVLFRFPRIPGLWLHCVLQSVSPWTPDVQIVTEMSFPLSLSSQRNSRGGEEDLEFNIIAKDSRKFSARKDLKSFAFLQFLALFVFVFVSSYKVQSLISFKKKK